ncbi:RecX family transcriptional regulator [Microbacterium sp. EYE_5]|nr:RecX family transcriptional regulator [Microbacterium sp. EYE_382]MCK6087131.1 RecX family transcriptional regulator [Microbacterium sp. EYE_384]MCK6124891.1 RecX family transcriptional regulator [Microbacterium sp. EYE_80]MCK6127894.1 RecX family transcriptional regulator [Microbacterium sp. EYE_79]MCK6142815.1 RecX family transcriptional regulator [Microbacterium sp. EYE_39]MCK6219540.1 RecX family transcriptional regulator [Microbacterium sp. EYE_5]MCK6229222.1 RecX family transcription
MSTDGGGERDSLAPVIPLFGGAAPSSPAADAGDVVQEDSGSPWHATWIDDRGGARSARAAHPSTPGGPTFRVVDESPCADVRAADDAERMLLRKLRTRSLSLREARAALRDHDLDDAEREEIVERFVSLGYLDDLALAEQLIDKATSRKAQGRQAIAQTLSQRSIPREVIDEALEALPDDEAERALEFARSKAAGFDGVERDAALRRLAGQLARRGYGAVALSAARQALDERSAPPRHGVRFEP